MTEKQIHLQVCRYLDLQYPKVIYTSDSSGVRVSIGMAKALKSIRCKGYKIPDLIIMHPNRLYHGSVAGSFEFDPARPLSASTNAQIADRYATQEFSFGFFKS